MRITGKLTRDTLITCNGERKKRHRSPSWRLPSSSNRRIIQLLRTTYYCTYGSYLPYATCCRDKKLGKTSRLAKMTEAGKSHAIKCHHQSPPSSLMGPSRGLRIFLSNSHYLTSSSFLFSSCPFDFKTSTNLPGEAHDLAITPEPIAHNRNPRNDLLSLTIEPHARLPRIYRSAQGRHNRRRVTSLRFGLSQSFAR